MGVCGCVWAWVASNSTPAAARKRRAFFIGCSRSLDPDRRAEASRALSVAYPSNASTDPARHARAAKLVCSGQLGSAGYARCSLRRADLCGNHVLTLADALRVRFLGNPTDVRAPSVGGREQSGVARQSALVWCRPALASKAPSAIPGGTV